MEDRSFSKSNKPLRKSLFKLVVFTWAICSCIATGSALNMILSFVDSDRIDENEFRDTFHQERDKTQTEMKNFQDSKNKNSQNAKKDDSKSVGQSR